MNIIEIFSCAGGMAEGLRRAGLPVTTAVDYSADACASRWSQIGMAMPPPLAEAVGRSIALVLRRRGAA
jgi:site-specific DNA-cytosine methylase